MKEPESKPAPVEKPVEVPKAPISPDHMKGGMVMPRNFYVRSHAALPRLDLIEAGKTVLIWTIGTIYVALLGFIIFAGIWIYSTSKAAAHEFYPPECCSGKDCAPLLEGRARPVSGGYMIDGIFFVSDAATRASPDRRYHGCFPSPRTLRCFYAPKPSM